MLSSFLSDYGKGTLADPQLYIQAAKQKNIPVLVDPKGKDFSRYRGATLLTPNRKEFEMVVGECHCEAELISKGQAALVEQQIQALLITRGEAGMTLLQQDRDPIHLPARAREVFDVTGAGDTVIALLAASIASGSSIEDAIVLANIAAGIVISRMGAASVYCP